MKKNDKRIDRVYSFFNAIRGNNTPNEYQSVLAVLKKVMVLQDCAQNEMDYDELYQLMESVATDFEIPNPFPEKERFVDIYRTLQGFDELSWTDILEYGDDRSKFRVPESVVDEMEKNFIDGFQEVLIAEAEKFSPFLERLVEAHFDSHFTLTTIDAFYYKVLNEMFDDNDMVDIKQTNIYQYEFTSEKFDLILSVPVFGVRDKADESSEFICRENDMIAAEKKKQAAAKKEEKKKQAKQAKDKKPKKEIKPKKVKVKEPPKPGYILKINPKSIILFILLIAGIIMLIQVFGYSINYNSKVNAAKDYFINGEYEKVYNSLSGMNLSGNEETIYNQSKVVMYVQRQYESYLNYRKMNMNTEAINALIKGVDRYQTYRAEGKELGVDDKMKESYDKIINALKDTYKISETEAISLADMSNSDFVTYYYKIEAYGEAVK